VDIDARVRKLRHLVNGRAAARSWEWAQHFSNASCISQSNLLTSVDISTLLEQSFMGLRALVDDS